MVLSYVLTTYNKLAYLRVTLPLLIAACGPDEEIVVVDGGSTDGTKEFLSDHYTKGNIHQLVSEKDFGEAHGTNKAMMLARGVLLKVITDDDVFCFPELRACRDYMLTNSHIDALGFDGFGINLANKSPEPSITRYIEGFKEWQITKTPFLFCGLSLMIRRSSLAYLGLLNPMFTIVDMEYSMRISSLKASLCFCSSLAFVNIVGPASNSVKFHGHIERERKRVNEMYLNKSPSKISAAVGDIRWAVSKLRSSIGNKKDEIVAADYAEVVDRSVKLMEDHNRKHDREFLTGG